MTMPAREIKINCEYSAASAPEEALSWRSVKISSQNVTCTDPLVRNGTRLLDM